MSKEGSAEFLQAMLALGSNMATHHPKVGWFSDVGIPKPSCRIEPARARGQTVSSRFAMPFWGPRQRHDMENRGSSTTCADPDPTSALAEIAEEAGFESSWAPEHIIICLNTSRLTWRRRRAAWTGLAVEAVCSIRSCGSPGSRRPDCGSGPEQ